MKVYLVAHKGYAPSPANMCAWVDYEGTANEFVASVHVMSVRAFLKRKYAADYIAKMPDSVRKYREIVAFSATQRARTRSERKSGVTPRRSRKDALNRTHARKNAS